MIVHNLLAFSVFPQRDLASDLKFQSPGTA